MFDGAMIPLYTYLIFLVLGLLIAWFLVKKENLQKEAEDYIFKFVNDDEVRRCGQHDWHQGVFATREEVDKAAGNPEEINKMSVPYCDRCGYVPSRNLQVTPKYLQQMRDQVAYAKEVDSLRKEIDELANEFFEFYSKNCKHTDPERALVRQGFDAHAIFVDQLPQLVAARRERKMLERATKAL